MCTMQEPSSFVLPQHFESLPFFHTKQVLINPKYCEYNLDRSGFSGCFYLDCDAVHSILKSWSAVKQEYKVQVILRLAQVGTTNDKIERLPYNIKVFTNGTMCKLPELNFPSNHTGTPWRYNVPIDIVQQSHLIPNATNKLVIKWTDDSQRYVAAVFLAEKLTWSELLVELKKRPMHSLEKSKLLIKTSLETVDDVGVDNIFASIKDPLTTRRMVLPGRGKDCTHLQCFDALQFLQMNEHKQTWLCPLCKKKLLFENLEIDEFFLNVVQSPTLSKDCETIVLLDDGSWTEKKPSTISNIFNQRPNKGQIKKIEEITLGDTDDDDDDPPPKHLKCDNPASEESELLNQNTLPSSPVPLVDPFLYDFYDPQADELPRWMTHFDMPLFVTTAENVESEPNNSRRNNVPENQGNKVPDKIRTITLE